MPERDVQTLLTQALLGEGDENGFDKKLFDPQTRSAALNSFPLSTNERIQLDLILEDSEGMDALIEACIERGLIQDWPKTD